MIALLLHYLELGQNVVEGKAYGNGESNLVGVMLMMTHASRIERHIYRELKVAERLLAATSSRIRSVRGTLKRPLCVRTAFCDTNIHSVDL